MKVRRRFDSGQRYMAKVWWEVTGQYSCVTDKKKPVKQRFCNSFMASSKTDAVNQAKALFAKMQREDPAGKYDNFTKIKANM